MSYFIIGFDCYGSGLRKRKLVLEVLDGSKLIRQFPFNAWGGSVHWNAGNFPCIQPPRVRMNPKYRSGPDVNWVLTYTGPKGSFALTKTGSRFSVEPSHV